MVKERIKKKVKEKERRQAEARERREIAKEKRGVKKSQKWLGGKKVTEEEYQREKSLTGTVRDPALARRKERRKETEKGQIKEEMLDIRKQEEAFVPEGIEVEEEVVKEDVGLFEKFKQWRQQNIEAGEIEKQRRIEAGEGPEILAGTVPIGAGGAGMMFKVGQKVMSAKKAVQTGNALKNAKLVKDVGVGIGTFALGVYGLMKTGEGLVGYFGGDKINEQQQALNTLGQMTTTIGGQATESAGDWRKGLQELRYIKSEVLRLEEAIKNGTIVSATLKRSGKIFDINADMADQLSTIDEQITIIESFVLNQNFPELDELTMQGYLRELEEEGYIKPYDVSSTRRETPTK